jgi:hypothetical protein
MVSKIQFWIRKKRIYIPLLLIFFYKLIFNSFTGQLILDQTFRSLAKAGSLNANVTTFSLFYGIEIEDISLQSGAKFQEAEIFSAKELRLRYNLPLLIFLRAKVSEIALLDTKIQLTKIDEVWNYEELFPPSNKTESIPTEEQVPEESPSEPSESLFLGVPISAYAKLNLQNVSFRMDDQSPKSPMALGWRDLNLHFELDTNRFIQIPYSLDALDLIDVLHLELNPKSPLFSWYKDSKLTFESPLDLSLILHSNNSNPFTLESSLKLGGDNLILQRNNKLPLIVKMLLAYDLKFFPEEDRILLKDFSCLFQNDSWFRINGEIKNVTSDKRSANLTLSDSDIYLEPLSRVLEELPIPKMKLGGRIQLSPLQVEGDLADLQLDWKLKASDLFFQASGKPHRSQYLQLTTRANVDLVTKEKPTAEKPLPNLKSIYIDTLKADYNGIFAHLTGSLGSEIPIDLNLNLDKLELGLFVSNLSGLLKADLKVTGDNFSQLYADLNAALSYFRFTMDRGRSGNSFSKISTKANLQFNAPFQLSKIDLNQLNLGTRNSRSAEALSLKSDASISLADAIVIDLKQTNLSTNLANLSLILPLSLKEKVIPVESALGSIIKLGLNGHFDLGEGSYKGNLTSIIPGIELNDLVGNFAVRMPPGENSKIFLDNLQFRAYKSALGLNAKGNLETRQTKADPPLGNYFGDLKLKIFLNSKLESYIAKGFSYRGEMYMDLNIKDYDVKGDLISNNSKIVFNNGSCPGNACKIFLIDTLNAEIPIHHDLSIKNTRELIEGDKSRFIKTYGRIPKDNLTIRQVLGSHPSIEGAPFAYVKSSGSYPGLTSRIQYKENYLFIDGIRLSLLDGMVYGKDFIINVGSGDLEKMEYMGSLQVRDIDLRQLLSKDAQDKIDDGKIKADLNLSGVNLDDPIPNINLYFSIFQIGRDFGKSAMNVISTKGAIMDFIIDSYAVDKVEVELSKGLVYADVLFKKSILSYVVSLEDSKISQQRMPLANFLKRAGSEISTYK